MNVNEENGSGGSAGSDASERQGDAGARALYPDAPWHLHGHACLSAWLVDTTLVPPAVAGTRYVRIGRRCVFFAVWARYLPGGTLAYDELAAGVLVHSRGVLPPAGTLHHVWVSDPAAAAGGRSLWHVPKKLGHFGADSDTGARAFAGTLIAQGQPVAALRFKQRFAVPITLPARGFVVQAGEGGPMRTLCTVRGELLLGHGDWDFAAEGALSFLRGKRPLFSARLANMRLSFGV
jgi:hypothetical protein